MKKLIVLLIPLVLITKAGRSQIIYSTYSQSYPQGTTDKPGNIGIVTCELELNNAFWSVSPSVQTRNYLQEDTAFLRNRPTDFVAINTFDTCKAHFFLHGVNKANAALWEYRVTIFNGKTLVPWSPVTQFSNKLVDAMSAYGQMAYLGGYYPGIGNWIVVDARKKGSREIEATSVVAWQTIAPRVTNIYTPDELNLFLSRLARPWSPKLTPEEAYKWHSRYTDAEMDMQTGIPKKFVAEANENNLIFSLNTEIYKKEQLEYQLVRDNNVVVPWKANDFDNGFIWLRDLKPGDYKLNMRFTAQREHPYTYPFVVKSVWYESIWFKMVVWLLSALLVGFVILYVKYLRQKEKTAKEQSNKNKLQLELKAIYAQLNPHFIFNALSSIQGLINKQDIKGANTYLADFAKLLRESLNNSNNEQTPLKQELVILDTYLKLEQLRFGFKYEIDIDENINVYETDIPPLLLQPLVENAVKHGVSDLDDKGDVSLRIQKKQDDMEVLIADNGPGFSSAMTTSGFGLKLTNDRIKLLNEMLNGQQIVMEIKGNSPSGAKIYLTFKNWFL